MRKSELDILKRLGGYYFGCVDEPGHYVFTPCNLKTYRGELYDWICTLDGMLTPKFTREEGKALLHHFDGFTVLAFWNYSVDTRGGSNSMFVFPGKLDLEQIIKLAIVNFPKIMNSFEFKITLAD